MILALVFDYPARTVISIHINLWGSLRLLCSQARIELVMLLQHRYLSDCIKDVCSDFCCPWSMGPVKQLFMWLICVLFASKHRIIIIEID